MKYGSFLDAINDIIYIPKKEIKIVLYHPRNILYFVSFLVILGFLSYNSKKHRFTSIIFN